MRLDISIHSGIKAFPLPFKPYILEKLTWDKIRELQRSPKYVMAIAKKLKGTWGRIVGPEKYLRILGFFLALGGSGLRLNIELSKRKPLKTLTISGWRKIVDPILGEIEYDARLEVFGWNEVLVKEKIPIPDGRLAFCWAALLVAIEGPKTRDGKLPPLITKEKAVEWLNRCLEEYPDPEKSLEDYIEKLEYNLKYDEKYNIPTWGHLIEEKTENEEKLSEVFLHIKSPVIFAFSISGYVRLNREQMEKLNATLKEGYSTVMMTSETCFRIRLVLHYEMYDAPYELYVAIPIRLDGEPWGTIEGAGDNLRSNYIETTIS